MRPHEIVPPFAPELFISLDLDAWPLTRAVAVSLPDDVPDGCEAVSR